jgi:RpiB/LacA/LacB family sugar-phosphate isomerase
MTVALGADHRGYRLKETIKRHLLSLGHEVLDEGTGAESPSVDYPDLAFAVAGRVARAEADRGILLCMTGVGMCIAANKVRGIRAARVTDVQTTLLSRQHNDANVLCLAGGFTDEETARAVVDAFLTTDYEGGRHERRIEKISERESI